MLRSFYQNNLGIKGKMASTPIQTKLKIGAANDMYEREADAMADRIMRMPNSYSSQPLTQGARQIQRKCSACEKEEEHIRRKPLMMKSQGGVPQATLALGSQLNSTKGSGSPLPSSTNQFMSSAFGADFSHVRIHTDSRAQQMNQGLNARAFTHGSDIYFNRGEYNPGSSRGKRLLGHELTHVVQQRGAIIHAKQQTNSVKEYRPAAAIDAISKVPERIMRVSWTNNMNEGRMPNCGTPQYTVFPSESAELGDIPSGARTNCRYTPLFHVPQFRLPDGRHRVIVRARVSPIPAVCREADWSINVYECFNNGSSLANGCESDRGTSYAGGSIASPLEVQYPRSGRQGLWSTRNLSVRVSNGCSAPIPVSLSVVYPSMPEPTAWEQFSEGLHMMLDLLGLTEPFGVFFDGVNAVIYAAEGEWLQAGLSASAAIPIAGAGIVTLRRMMRGGEEVIGMTIRREALPLLRSEDVAAALRHARESRGNSPIVPIRPQGPPSSGGVNPSTPPTNMQSRIRSQIELFGESFMIGGERHHIGTFYDIVPMFGLCSHCGSLTSRLNDVIELLPLQSQARRETQELMGRVMDADRRLQRGAAGRSGGLDPTLESPLLRAFMHDLGNIASNSPEVGRLLTMDRNRMGVLARGHRTTRILQTLRSSGRTSLRTLGLLATGTMEISGNRLVLNVTMIQGRVNLTTLFRTALEIAREAEMSSLVVRGRPIGEAWAARLARRFSGVRQGRMSSYSFPID